MATHHFTRFGFRRTSLADVARELGVVKGALYYHFPGGKAELFDATAARLEEEILQAMREAAAGSRDAHQGLKAVFAAKFDAMRHALDSAGVSPEIARELALVPREAGAFHQKERAILEELLARGERERVFRRMRLRAATAAALQALLREPLLSAALSSSPPASGARALPPAIFDVVFYGLAAPQGSRRSEVSR